MWYVWPLRDQLLRGKLYFLAGRIEELIINLAMSVALNSFIKLFTSQKCGTRKKQYVFRWPYRFNCTVILFPESSFARHFHIRFLAMGGSVFSLHRKKGKKLKKIYISTNSAS